MGGQMRGLLDDKRPLRAGRGPRSQHGALRLRAAQGGRVAT